MFAKDGSDAPGCGADWFAISTDVREPQTLPGYGNLPAHHHLKLVGPDLGVIGCWSEDEFHLRTGPAGHVLAFGFCPRFEFFAELVQNSCSDSAIDRLMPRLPGSFHLIVARLDGTFRVQGSASGLRRVFVTDSSAPHVVSSRLDILARIIDSRPDISALGTRLLHPGLPPHPLRDRSPWQGIRAVTPGHAATVQQGKPPETRTWWTPPEPARTLKESASVLAEALRLSVTERINRLPKSGGFSITADLSGGLDSTPLCFLINSFGIDFLTFSHANLDPAGDDLQWVRLAQPHLDWARSLTLAADELPHCYHGIGHSSTMVDEPDPGIRNHARLMETARRLIAEGSVLHFGGSGGDELFLSPPSALHTIFQSNRWLAIQRAKAFRARRPNVSWVRIMHALTDSRPYGQWLHEQLAASLDPGGLDHLGGWTSAFRFPPWATEDVLAESQMFLAGLDSSRLGPLAPTRGQHASIEGVRLAAYATRLTDQVLRGSGVRTAYPYLDDHVIEVCLSVRLEERSDPWRFKPLIKEAMKDVVPATLLTRGTKADAGAEVAQGLRNSRSRILDMCEHSVLAEVGMLDTARLSRVVHGPTPPDLHPDALNETLACEDWARVHGVSP